MTPAPPQPFKQIDNHVPGANKMTKLREIRMAIKKSFESVYIYFIIFIGSVLDKMADVHTPSVMWAQRPNLGNQNIAKASFYSIHCL